MTPTLPTGLFARALAAFESPPLSAIYRIAIGLIMWPLYFSLGLSPGSIFTLLAFVMVILVLLRVIPAVLRKVFPFSRDLQAFWKSKRQLAKRFDSFQWQKLFWIGCGQLVFLFSTNQLVGNMFYLSLFCLLSGAFGLLVWTTRAVPLQTQSSS